MLKEVLEKNPYQFLATAAFVDLFILCICWEWFISPLRPGGSWLILKGIPLLFAIPGLWKGKVYTMQWASMLVMIYFIEGVVRITDSGLSSYLAAAQVALSLLSYIALLAYLKPLKRAAKLQKSLAEKS